MSLSMSALGHTMASMGRDGGKPGALTSNDSSSRRPGANRTTSSNTQGSNSAAARGQNINHLLAFTLPPRLSNAAPHSGPRRPRKGGNYAVPFNKERYVNAQYRFLVKPTGDYTAYFADADIFLNWADILTVLISTTSALSTASHVTGLASTAQSAEQEAHEGASCPICLSPPTAPRMTKCGHVYCYPCILHYLTVHESAQASGSTTPTPGFHIVPGAAPRASAPATPTGLSTMNAASNTPKWKRCPVCWDAVYARDLKAVQWWDPRAQAAEFEKQHNESASTNLSTSDDYLCMRLIERPHLTTLALPQSSTWPYASTSTSDQPLIAQHAAPWHFQPDVMAYSKYMLATPDLLLQNLNSDLLQLEEERRLLQSFTIKDEAGLMFVKMAERKVHEQMEKVTNELDTQSVRSRIGYARKELAEHYELQMGNIEREAANLSRRQRKKLERGTKAEGEGEKERITEEGETGIEVVGTNADDFEGAKDFLANQDTKRGGNIIVQKTTDASDSDEGRAKEGRSAPVSKETRSAAPRSRRNLNPPAPSSSSFFFYQASSGQSIFLHPLDIKILLSAFNTYAAFPKTLDVFIQGADEGSMNEEMRKRCKYLTHLSKGADIVFVEVDWDRMVRDAEANSTTPPISRKILGMYEQPLKQRRSRRRDRERREDRAKVRSEEKERASRPTPMSSQPIGIGGMARSPILSAADEFGSSAGSHTAMSPTLQAALLQSMARNRDEFPAVQSLEEDPPALNDELGTSLDSTTGSQRRPMGNKPISSAATTTVWGTPQSARGSFASALHKSSRASGRSDDDAPDWDAWLEIEEDFIVGARNNTTIREGRGLNKQTKRGENGVQNNGNTLHSKEGKSSGGGGSSSGSQDEAAPPGLADAASVQTPRTIPHKSQKKKKLVLTAGGGGRGTR